ncbi:MAG: GGDEF domain-containing protein [Clostridiales bacterium]|nr:GGDEF domain-containing protein [Clostridiales bacterium]
MLKLLIGRIFGLNTNEGYKLYQFDSNIQRFKIFSVGAAIINFLLLLSNFFSFDIFIASIHIIYIIASLLFYQKFKAQAIVPANSKTNNYSPTFIFLYILIIGILQLLLFWRDVNSTGNSYNIILLIGILVLIPDLDFYITSFYLSSFLLISAIIALTNKYFAYYPKIIFDLSTFYLIGFIVAFFNSNRGYNLFERSEQLKKANELLAMLVVTDNLTSLHNRRAFEENFYSLWLNCKRAEKPFSILMIDVDNFKSYNDTLGHPAGDKALIAISSIMRKSLRRATDFLARYGGEEFVILLPFTPRENAIDIAENIRADIEKEGISHPKNQASEFVTVSIGVSSMVPNDSYSRNSLLITADEALYQAKIMGKNKVHYKSLVEAIFEHEL